MTHCYFYNSGNKRILKPQHFAAIVVAALSIPLIRFRRTNGCTIGTGKLLKKDSIRKKFKVEILDPVQMGVCTFLGFGFDAIPDSTFKKIIKRKYYVEDYDLVFEKTGKNKCIFVVSPKDCDATPIVSKKK